MFSTLNRKLDYAILCILDKRCLNDTAFYETEVGFAVRDKQHTKQVIFSILTLRVHRTITMVALRVNRNIPARLPVPKVVVFPIFNWMKRQYFCQTKDQESD